MISNQIIIIISKLDEAGMNMFTFFEKQLDLQEKQVDIPSSWPEGTYQEFQAGDITILLIPESQIYTDYFQEGLSCNLLVFASKHSSAAGQKALLVHTTGIWQEEAGHGGRDHELAFVRADLMGYAYDKIKQYQTDRGLDQYWTGIECTHHGPTALSMPIIYYEAGGTKEEWNDLDACELIADVIIETITDYLQDNIPQREAFIGLGGNHYCSSFIKTLDEQHFGFGHILPKYATKKLPVQILQQAFDKTIAEKKLFLVDKKGLRAHDRDRFIAFIEKNDWNWQFT